jgi:dipeptidyl aminopeptidase/acylaminoacyl peptidase
MPTYRQITFRRGLATSGRFTPDGKTVIYAASWDDAPGPEVFSVRTDAPESKSLGLPPAQVVGVSSKGELAVLLAQTSLNRLVLFPNAPETLARVPLSGGTPRPVAEDVICADWAPDGERLAAFRWVQGSGQIEFPLGTVLARGVGLRCPRISPRGDRLAFGVPDGYRVIETAPGRSFSITGIPEVFHDEAWSWSPSGDEIWFTASDAAEDRPLEAVTLSGRRRTLARIPGALTLYDVSRDGLVLLEHAFSRNRVLARAPGSAAEHELSVFDRTTLADVSADGRLALLSEVGGAIGRQQFVYLRPTDGSPPIRLAEEGEPYALSPDGRWVLVGPARGTVVGAPGWQGLRIVPTGAGEVRAIATPELAVHGAQWDRDGKQILLRGREAARSRTFVLDPGSGTRRAVTPEGVANCAVGRQRVACLGPPNRLALYPLDGGEPRELPGIELGPDVGLLRLSEDESSLIVSRLGATRTAPVRVERVDLATGRRTLLHELRPADMAGVVLAYAGQQVTPDGRGYAYGYQQYLHNLYLADGFR